MQVSDGTVTDVRLAFGAVAHRSGRARAAEDALRGGPATPVEFAAAADVELRAAEPLRDNGFKVALTRRLVVAILSQLARTDEETGR